MEDFFTPVGLAALIIAIVGVVVREFKDRPRIKRVEDDRKQDQIEIKELREANAGLKTMVNERFDFTKAVNSMADMVRVVKEGIDSGHQLRSVMTERMEAHSRATSEEHTAIVGTLREQTSTLREIRDFISKLTPTVGATGPKGERGEKGDHGQDAKGKSDA